MNMEERIRPTRSGLFAIELLIAVGIFSLCAAICVGLFVRSEVMSRDSADLNRAVNEARSAAECFKAAGGDLAKTAELTGGAVENDGSLCLLYDESWQKIGDCGTGVENVFLLMLSPQAAEGYAGAELRAVGPLEAGSLEKSELLEQAAAVEPLLAWDIAALEVGS